MVHEASTWCGWCRWRDSLVRVVFVYISCSTLVCGLSLGLIGAFFCWIFRCWVSRRKVCRLAVSCSLSILSLPVVCIFSEGLLVWIKRASQVCNRYGSLPVRLIFVFWTSISLVNGALWCSLMCLFGETELLCMVSLREIDVFVCHTY